MALVTKHFQLKQMMKQEKTYLLVDVMYILLMHQVFLQQEHKLTNPNKWVVLPNIISKEPLGPLVRHGDHQWGDVVRWSLNTLIIAEELGINSSNVDDMKSSNIPEVLRVLGVEGGYGEMLELSNDFAYNIIKQVGNYSESFDRNIGPDTPLGIGRNLNALWTDGGILIRSTI